LQGYEVFYEMTDRLPKEQVLEIQQNSDLLLMVAHKNIKGVTSSKIFEYLSLQKPFIVCPNDLDVLEEIAIKSGLGVVLEESNDVFQYLSVIYSNEFQIEIKKLEQFKENVQIKLLTEEIVKFCF
jgi:hypothetical protein